VAGVNEAAKAFNISVDTQYANNDPVQQNNDILLLLRAPGFYLDSFIGAFILAAATMNRVIQKEP
jgi:hypothetical protein